MLPGDSRAKCSHFRLRPAQRSYRPMCFVANSPVEYKFADQVDPKARQQRHGSTPKPIFVTVALRIPRFVRDDRASIDSSQTRRGNNALAALRPRRDVLKQRIFRARAETLAFAFLEASV